MKRHVWMVALVLANFACENKSQSNATVAETKKTDTEKAAPKTAETKTADTKKTGTKKTEETIAGSCLSQSQDGKNIWCREYPASSMTSKQLEASCGEMEPYEETDTIKWRTEPCPRDGSVGHCQFRSDSARYYSYADAAEAKKRCDKDQFKFTPLP